MGCCGPSPSSRWPTGGRAAAAVTGYRKRLIEARTAEGQRLSKVLEDAGIKIDSVASSLNTASARDMINALVAGERDPSVLAQLARGVMRKKIPELVMACDGRFTAAHAQMCLLAPGRLGPPHRADHRAGRCGAGGGCAV